MSPALVLMTVNSPYRRQLQVDELAGFLRDHCSAKTVPGHMSSFFGDVKPDLQIAFALMFDISESELTAAATAFAEYSGESYPFAA